MKQDALAELLDEVRLLRHRMVQAGERLHAREPVTLGMRAVLELLLRGPATVPQLARSRHVSRQHIQVLVDGLLEQRLVTLAPNAAHKRSFLVGLTRAGEQTIRRMRRREIPLLRKAETRVRQRDAKSAAAVLRAIRASLGGEA